LADTETFEQLYSGRLWSLLSWQQLSDFWARIDRGAGWYLYAVGEPLPAEVVRAAMLIRANTLAIGHSGIRLETLETLIAMLNAGVHPVIPSQGSLGASGDLAPLAHLAQVLSRDPDDDELFCGEALYQGERLTGCAAMARAGLARRVLGAKEALALNNGATFSAALAALAVGDAEHLLDKSLVALAMSLEALRGVSRAYDAHLHAARKQLGQMAVAAKVRELLAGSTLIDATDRVQDAYSLRAAPQVLGAVKDSIAHVRSIIERELNAATDNPLIFLDLEGENKALSGGNFHGEPIALAMDFLSILASEIASISERRIARLLDDKLNDGLPAMLVEHGGLDSGLMMAKYTAASLVSENKVLAHPDSVDSIPTSANQEDFNPMATSAARHARQIVAHGETVVALINGEQVTLKRFYVEAQGIRLQPANPAMEPLYLRHDEIEILGIVTGVVRMTAA